MANNLKIIKPLVIGIGVAGKRHLEAQLALGIQTGIYTTNPDTTKLLKTQENVIIFDDLNNAIDWSNLVHVCTPDDKHAEFVAMALKKKKAVLCEKSFTTSLTDAKYLQNLANKHKSLLLIGQNYRLTPTFLETKKRVLAGDLGTITKIETTYLHDRIDYQKRYLDKNFLYIGGSHAVDLACWIANEEIVSIEAFSDDKLSYRINIKFSSGMIGNIKLDATSSRSISGTDLIVEGEYGKLISHNKSDQLLYYKTDNQDPQSINLANNKTFTTLLEVEIVDKFLSNEKDSYWPLPDVDEAINTIKILDEVQKISS